MVRHEGGGPSFRGNRDSAGSPDFKERVSKLSATKKVPVLIDGEIVVWESLAIIEYVAEMRPDARLWPADRAPRAHARAIANEMHAGFVALRRHCPMNMARQIKARDLTDEVIADVKRIDALWQMCLARFGGGGPFLSSSSAQRTQCMHRLSAASIPTRLR